MPAVVLTSHNNRLTVATQCVICAPKVTRGDRSCKNNVKLHFRCRHTSCSSSSISNYAWYPCTTELHSHASVVPNRLLVLMSVAKVRSRLIAG